MDPRPYHYEFRKPRLSNPTYKSDNLYQSIYHMGAYGKIYPNGDKISTTNHRPQGYTLQLSRAQRSRQIQQKLSKEIGRIDPYYQDMLNKHKSEQQAQISKNSGVPANDNKYSRDAKSNHDYNQELPKQQDLDSRRKREGFGIERNFRESRSYSQDSPNMRFKQDVHEEPGYISGYGNRIVAMPAPRRGMQDAIYQRQQKPYNIINCYPKQVPNSHRAYPKYTQQNKLIEIGYYPYIQLNPQKNHDNR